MQNKSKNRGSNRNVYDFFIKQPTGKTMAITWWLFKILLSKQNFFLLRNLCSYRKGEQ